MRVEDRHFPLSDFEKAEAQAARGNAALARMPVALLRHHVLTHLEEFRNPPGIVFPPEPELARELTEDRLELPGEPAPVRLTVIRPTGEAPVSRPLVYFIHGGGFMGGDSRLNATLMRLLADRTGSVVASVDYNVAPEAKFPTALRECQAGLAHVIGHGEYGVDAERVFLLGESAGGNLAAALAITAQAERPCRPRGQILIYPVTDMDKLDSPSYHDDGPEFRTMYQFMHVARDCYLPDKATRRDPLATLLYAEFDGPQPDALVMVAERDGLRDDGLRYAEKLAAAGGHVRAVVYRGARHAFINNLGRSPTADDAAAE
ncbi:MAG: alpha/beta hydrolase, partial [Propionibacteriaceae bacterium]|nr:alpha/beta hydrolase [Propionibacteriaceae bacterium]